MPQEPKEFICTPSSLLASYPCLACLSEHEMLAGLVGIAANASEKYYANLELLLKDSACFTCMGKKDMFQAVLTMLGSEMVGAEPGAMQAILDRTKCLLCANDQQLRAAFLFLISNYMRVSGERGND